jgi:hypothetical protein
MKDLAIVAMLLLPACICFGGAVYLMATGVVYGWGWLLFIGVLCSSISYNNKFKGDE